MGDETEPDLAQAMVAIDRSVDQWAFFELLNGVPMRPLTVASYRRELKAYTIGEIAAGRCGQVDDRPPY